MAADIGYPNSGWAESMAFSSYPSDSYHHVPPFLDEPYYPNPYGPGAPGGPPGPGPGGANYGHPNGFKQPGPLTVVANSSVLSGDSTMYPWYRVAFLGGIDLRQGPHIDAPRVGITLGQNATFAASEELPQPDGRVYLRLADGRGWAFDDSALYPHDPVVIRGFWSPIGPGSIPAKTDLAALQPGGQPAGARGLAPGLDIPVGAPGLAPGPSLGPGPPVAPGLGALGGLGLGQLGALEMAPPGDLHRDFDRAPGGGGIFN